MKGIHISAIIATVLSSAIIGGVLFRKSPREDYPLLVSAFLLLLPISPLAFYLIRLPLDRWLQSWLGQTSAIYEFFGTFYAPLIEEPIKLWILLIPWFLRELNSQNTLRAAIAMGLGFGIGEIWLLALVLVKNPTIASLPWYSLGGFLSERFMLCLMHGVFTATALRQIHKHFWMGLLGAMALHYLANFPIYLASVNFVGFGKAAWQMVLAIWVPLYFLATVGLLVHFLYGRLTLKKLSLFINGRAQCPDCGTVYIRPLFGVNGMTKRYERCPACKKWHWIGIRSERKDIS